MTVGALCLAIMVLTEPKLAIVWDEGYTLGRQERVRSWLGAMWEPAGFAGRWQPPIEDLVLPNKIPMPDRSQMSTRSGLLSPDVLPWFWPFAREEPDGHPPVYALVGLMGDVLAPTWETLPRARLGPMIVFSITCGAVFSFCRARWGLWAGLAAAGTWVFQPHLFALAHYATYDGLLTSFWTGSLIAFFAAVEHQGPRAAGNPRWRWVAVFGIVLGAAMGTKLTGWLLPVPFLIWVAIYRDRRGLRALAAGILLALILLVLLIPTWWHNPLLGFDQFFQSNLTRATTTPLKTLFLGTIYETPTGSLPWFNTALWTLMVTPIGILVLGLIGIFRALERGRSDPAGVLVVTHWGFLMVLRALPHMPGHDAVRQFLPAFGILALLAGLGAELVARRLRTWGRLIIVAAIVEGGASVALMMPVPLSYFSPLVGGLPGAAAIGMEPTFYWDALTPEILDWLNVHTSADQKVMFARYPTSLLYLRQQHRLNVKIMPHEPGVWAWYVLQNRPGALRRMERYLLAHGHPATVYRKGGVPLIWVFPYRDVEAWENQEPVEPRSGQQSDQPGLPAASVGPA
jgi:4-amino-4-deoxy-L-arabinose transferase-like glycosyltransferase